MVVNNIIPAHNDSDGEEDTTGPTGLQRQQQNQEQNQQLRHDNTRLEAAVARKTENIVRLQKIVDISLVHDFRKVLMEVSNNIVHYDN